MPKERNQNVQRIGKSKFATKSSKYRQRMRLIGRGGAGDPLLLVATWRLLQSNLIQVKSP